MWSLSHAYVTCDITFCLLCLECPNKKKPQNKIKKNKIKEKRNRIKLSPLFTTLTILFIDQL